VDKLENSWTSWPSIVVFPSSSVLCHASFLLLMGSIIFFIVGGFFCFGGCTGLEECAPAFFSVVLSWLGGFSALVVALRWKTVLWRFFLVFSWLGGFSVVLSLFLLMCFGG
jgi:hypothetical protein